MIVLDYSPGQARDKNGRWVKSGTSAGANAGKGGGASRASTGGTRPKSTTALQKEARVSPRSKAGQAIKAHVAAGEYAKAAALVRSIQKIKAAKAATAQSSTKQKSAPKRNAATERLAAAKRLVTTGGSGTRADAAVVTREVAKMPTQVLHELHAAGVKIVACRDNITDHLAELRGVQPRGWPPESGWHQVPGIYHGPRKEVVIATTRENGKVSISKEHGTANLVAHESGHALDFARGEESARTAFQTAYTADATRGKMIPYLLQKGGAGAQEAYAESFAAHVARTNPGDQFHHTAAFWNKEFGK